MGWQNDWTRRYRRLITLIVAIALIIPIFMFTDSAVAKQGLEDPIKTHSGYITGTVYGNVKMYLGIPYAAPPVGELRWKAPQPVTPWKGVKDCTSFSDSSPQLDVGFCPGPYSEDCLYLNVLTPAQKKNDRLPVMVWFHGGGYSIGSGNQSIYNLPDLAQHGAVVVTVNHRLNVMGLFAHPELSKESPNGVSGNYMLLDQIAALEWVQKNIKEFGGDPKNVTIFGQSGGGGKVDGLMASPLAKGLFQRAIYQSGIARAIPLAEAEERGERLVAQLGLSNSEDVLAALRELPWEDLVNANVALGGGSYHGLVDTLVVDGYVLPDTPENIFKAGKQNTVPIITLTTLGELIADKTFLSTPQIIEAYATRMKAINNSGAQAYTAVFSHVPSKWKDEGVLAYHGLEVYYLFGGLDELTKPAHFNTFAKPSGATQPDPGLKEVDTDISNAMMDIWVQFAATGDPSVEGLVDWPAWNENSDEYLDIAWPLVAKTGYTDIVSSSSGDHPLIFIHGYAGSASQFRSQAMRFASNGYPQDNLYAFEYDTSKFAAGAKPEVLDEVWSQLDQFISTVKQNTGADKVDIAAHSLGTTVTQGYLNSSPERAANVGRYVNIDGATAQSLPGGVPTLAIWAGQGTSGREITGATNVTVENQTHVQSATSSESFEHMYKFLTGEEPATSDITPETGGTVNIAGRVIVFPQNTGPANAQLEIYKINHTTGYRTGKQAAASYQLGNDGSFGPFVGKKGQAYEFVLIRDDDPNHNEYYYFEPFIRSDYFLRLPTSAQPGVGMAASMESSDNHANLIIGRDKEFWGDQPGSNDVLTINGTDIISAATHPISKRVNYNYIYDKDVDGASNLGTPIQYYFALPFFTGVDFFIPGANPPDGTISIVSIPRDGNGSQQVINVPNRASSSVGRIHVQFND